MKNEKEPEGQMQYMPIGMCIGIGIGTAIGAAMGSIGTGMCMGLSIGMCIGAFIDAQNKKKTSDTADKPDDDENKEE